MATTTTTSITQPLTTSVPIETSTMILSKLQGLIQMTTKSSIGNTQYPITEEVHEFAWGKSKEDDEAFTFSPTPTPTKTNIYIEYIKKKLAKGMKKNLTETTPQPILDKTKSVFEKFNKRKPISTTTADNIVQAYNEYKYENPQHYIEKIAAQKNKAKQPHTVLKKTHITIDEVEQHSVTGKSDSIEKHIELDESETDMEGENQYETGRVFNDVGKSQMRPKILESQWSVSPEQKSDSWLPITVSQAAVNIAKDKSYQPHG